MAVRGGGCHEAPMLILALLLQTAAAMPAPPEADTVVVHAPLPATPQVPATMVAEPAAMLMATFDTLTGEDADPGPDGFIDRGEVSAGIARIFPDGAGMRYLAYSDWALRWLGDRAALPSPYEVDRNSDDIVTLAEMQDHFSRLFSRYDRDGDKRVSRAELLTFRTMPIDAIGPAITAPRTKDGKPPKERPRR